MLAVSSLSSCDIETVGSFNGSFSGAAQDQGQELFIHEFVGGPAALEDFSFDDLFLDFSDKDVLPDLEVEPSELNLGDFSFDGDDDLRTESTAVEDLSSSETVKPQESTEKGNNKEESTVEISSEKAVKKSSTAKAKGSHGKKKGKVDWTPELHRRFVQAVEELGVDKAVPSRILEIMGTDCLTRHNVASHLQKYRSHRKHLLTREAEAASWSHRKQMCAGGAKRHPMNGPWPAPAIGYLPPHPPAMQHPFRPLHVWGHPPTNMWAPPPPPHWLPPAALPPAHPSSWLPHYPAGSNAVTQGTACFIRPVPHAAMRFPAPLVPCAAAIHPHNKQPGPLQLQPLDARPSKESVDAAIGDVLTKPWLPLPLGLKPPSLESVLGELQKQGVSRIPPAKA